jgi:hypothetical protein
VFGGLEATSWPLGGTITGCGIELGVGTVELEVFEELGVEVALGAVVLDEGTVEAVEVASGGGCCCCC